MRGSTKKAIKHMARRGCRLDEESGLPAYWKIHDLHHGRKPSGWHIHHIDYDKSNDAPENLIALPSAYHAKLHRENSSPTLGRAELAVVVAELTITQQRLYDQAQEYLEQYEKVVRTFKEVIGTDLHDPSPRLKTPKKLKKPKRVRGSKVRFSDRELRLSPVSTNPANDVAAIMAKKRGG